MKFSLRLFSTLLIGAVPLLAAAQAESGLQFRVGVTAKNDSNPFFISDSQNLTSTQGSDKKSDTITITNFGVSFNGQKGLQKYLADVDIINSKYQNFSKQNNTATNYRLGWNWAVTPKLTGNLSNSRNETLNNDLGSSENNRRINYNTQLNAQYNLAGQWFLTTGIAKTKQESQQTSVTGSDFASSSLDFGGLYVFPSGSSIGFTARTVDGKYLNTASQANTFQQEGFGGSVDWSISPRLRFKTTANAFSRKHPNNAVRNFDGADLSTELRWSATGKLTLTGSLEQKTDDVTLTNANYSVSNKFTFTPSLQLTGKTSLRGSAQWIDKTYGGGPTSLSSPTTESYTNYSATLVWQIQPKAQLSTTWEQHSGSRSNLLGGDFGAQALSINAIIIF